MEGITPPPPPGLAILDLTLPTPAENLALDESLLLAAEAGTAGEVLRLWESPGYAVVLGSGGSVAIDVNVSACEADGVQILRRASGGGTVIIGPGCLCFSVVLNYDRAPGLHEIRPSAHHVLATVLNAVHLVLPDATIEGISDLAAHGIKFSGSAQQRKRRHFLHHGTLLCGFELDRVSRYLNAPERQPEYRQNRPHGEFIRNLPVDTATMMRLLVTAWKPVSNYGPPPWDTVQSLVAEKYSREEWHRRR